MLYRLIVMVCIFLTAAGGKLRFMSGRLLLHFFPFDFSFYARSIVILSTITSVLEVWEMCLFHGGEFRLSFRMVMVMDLRLLLTRHYSGCPLENSQGGCSFGLFNCDSYVTFWASGVLWGFWELVAELVYSLISSLSLVLTLWENNNEYMKTTVRGACPGAGQVERETKSSFDFNYFK